jgi:hypothetical protein
MVEPIDSRPILQKLLEKTQAGRVRWNLDLARTYPPRVPRNVFFCDLEDGTRFEVGTDDDVYWTRMLDSDANEIFSVHVQDEIIFGDGQKKNLFDLIRNLYDLARRKALDVDRKLAGAAAVLDKL